MIYYNVLQLFVLTRAKVSGLNDGRYWRSEMALELLGLDGSRQGVLQIIARWAPGGSYVT
jgi:hypothetical protein